VYFLHFTRKEDEIKPVMNRRNPAQDRMLWLLGGFCEPDELEV